MGHAFNIQNATSCAKKAKELEKLLNNPIPAVSKFILQAGKLDGHILSEWSPTVSKQSYQSAKKWYNKAASRLSELPVRGIAISLDHLFGFRPTEYGVHKNAPLFQGAVLRQSIQQIQKEMVSLGINAFAVQHTPQENGSNKFYQDIIFVPYTKVRSPGGNQEITYEEGDPNTIRDALAYFIKKGILDLDDTKSQLLIEKTFALNIRNDVINRELDLSAERIEPLNKSDLTIYSPQLTDDQIMAIGKKARTRSRGSKLS